MENESATLTTRNFIRQSWDRITLGVSLALIVLGFVVLLGWHFHLRAAVQVFPGMISMQYNTALCFLALGVAGIGLSTRRRLCMLGGGMFIMLMGGAVILEYIAGVSTGIDTLFFYPWERTLSADPGRMALTTAINFFLMGSALLILGARRDAHSVLGIVSSISLSLALTSLIGYAFQVTYVLPFSLGTQMALHTSIAFLACGIAMLGHAWKHARRGPDGLPCWCAGIGAALLPVLLVGAAALTPEPSWLVVPVVAIAGVVLVTMSIRWLTTTRMAWKGLLMIAMPLGLLLVFVGLVTQVKNQSESAQAWTLHSNEVIGTAGSLLAQTTEAESAVRGYAITGDEEFSKSYTSSAALVAPTLSRLRGLISDNSPQVSAFGPVAQLAEEKMERLADTANLIRTGQKQRVEERIKEGRGFAVMRQLREATEVFLRVEERLGAERRQKLEAAWQRLSWLLVAGTAAAILLACILSLSFSGGISNRLQRLRDNALALAAGQTLGPTMNGRDEIAELDRVFHDMANSLGEATRHVETTRLLEGRLIDVRHSEALLKAGALQNAIFNSANFSSIATDAKGVIQIFNVGAERMLGYSAAAVINKITPADISDPQEVVARARELSIELGTPITPGFEALVFKAYRGIEDIYELTYIRKDGSRFPAVVSVTALRDPEDAVIGYLLIGTDNTARKQAEEALREAGALQNAIFNSANFSSIATDARGVIQIFNVGAERMLGYSAADVLNRITPADISDPQEVVARAKALSLELGTPILPGFEALVFKASREIEDIYELTYIRKDGSRFPAVVSVTALRDDGGTIIGYLLIGTDNTARKRAEEALLQAGALQNAIFNSANFSSIATDAKGVIQIFNVGAERMLGYAAADVIDKITQADLHDPQEVITRAKALSLEYGTPIAPGFEALVFKAAHGIEDIYEATNMRKDGSRFSAMLSVTALRDPQNVIIGYLLISTDNTARKQVEEERKQLDQRLRDQQFYTRSLIEANIDAIMTTDPLGIITDVNKQMEALTGCTRDELIGAPFKNYFTDPSRAEAGIRLVLEEKKVADYELTARNRDGHETVVSYNATTFYDRERKLQGVFAAARDVTERRRYVLALQETNTELESAKSLAEKANLAKSEFLSSMSHELRSPLNAILGFAQLMESATPPPPADQAGRITQILQAGWHLLKLINEILDLAVIESGQVSLSQESVSLAEVMSECHSMMEPQAEQRDIHMSFPVFDNPIFVRADMTRLKQIVINLLSNAIKYNKEHGSVVVECTVSSPERIRISVRDTGEGLSPEKVTQLFQPFNRLGQETGGITGTGIGLVVTKRLAELMDGTLGAESTPGLGSVFWCELTETAAPELEMLSHDAGDQIRPPLSDGAAPRTLLYVEDNPANMELVGQLIERCPDIRMIPAVNATRGIELARTTLPTVILMDINLPGISGIEALQILLEDSTTAHIPVVALSANAMARDIARGLEAGFFRYLTKPIVVHDFMETLNAALEFAEKKAPQIN